MSGLLGSSHLGACASDLLDGRLTASQEHQARQHLGGCRECAAAVHREQQVRTALRASGAAPTPGGNLMAGLMALAASDAAPPGHVLAPRRGGVLRTAAVLGTVSVASAGALGLAVLAGPSALSAPSIPSSVAGSGSTTRPSVADVGGDGLSTTTVGTAVQPGLSLMTGAFNGGTPLRGVGASFQQGP